MMYQAELYNEFVQVLIKILIYVIMLINCNLNYYTYVKFHIVKLSSHSLDHFCMFI